VGLLVLEEEVCVYSTKSQTVPPFLIHPDVDSRLKRGDFSLSRMGVLKGIGEHYD